MSVSARTSASRWGSPRRARALWLWMGFGIASLGLAGAVHHLYRTVTRELEEQATKTSAEEFAKASERVRVVAEEMRHEIFAKLASLHVDGLAYALKKWDESNPAVVGTFVWDRERGFAPDPALPRDVKPEDITALWERLRDWRANHLRDAQADLGMVGNYAAVAVRTLANPEFSEKELGYQGENLEMVSYAGGVADPWAGWAASPLFPEKHWIFWYQAGPAAHARGCFVDPHPFIARLRAELASTPVTRIELLGIPVRPEAGVNLGSVLPGYTLRVRPGEVFDQKRSSVRLAAVSAVSLLGLFLTGVAFMVTLTRREAREAARKTTFVTQVSHELRTPLTSIQMFADMLGAPEISGEKRQKFATTISRESQRLGALIERLLLFNALERGKHATHLESVELALVVRETVDAMETALRAAGLRIEVYLPVGPLVVKTDRSAVKQALLNLLDNAQKYARGGEVVRIDADVSPECVALRVADDGPGIPAGLEERIFEPFVQGGQTLTEKSPGVGLGLSLARGFLRNAGADLVLVPAEKGARFEIRLPRASVS